MKSLVRRIPSYLETLGLLSAMMSGANKSRKYISTNIDNTNRINKESIVLILVIKNEANRLEFFLKYYRDLGVDHFILLDNLSDDNIQGEVKNQKDISLFEVSQEYSESRYGVHWINHIARKYCMGNWVLSVDTDEFFIFPYSDTRNIGCLRDYLEDIGKNYFFTPMVDMYSKSKISEAYCRKGQNPLEVANLFDGAGYFRQTGGLGDTWIRGGIRLRVFYKDSPFEAPAINKIAFRKWHRASFYYSGAHVLLPKRDNKINFHYETSGALLHFKFLSDLQSKAEYAVRNKNHYNDSKEYKKYLEELNILSGTFVCSLSKKFINFDSIVEAGLASYGDWH